MSAVAPGTPVWVDIGSPDLEGTKRFYGGLFGWVAELPSDPQAGEYTIFTLGGKAVAGAGPLFGEGQPPAWTTYVSTDDADAAARRVEEHGGKVLMPPFDVLEHGRMAGFTDPSGAFFSVWQPRAMPGAALFNVPGALCWNELETRDPDSAKAFYSAVFGWAAKDTVTEGYTYTEWRLGDRSIGGMRPMDESFPPEVPPHWLVYFGVADCDAAVARATELGAQVVVAPISIPAGRFAVLTDPVGAVFAVFQM